MDLGDLGQIGKVVPHSLSQVLERALVGVTRNNDFDHLGAPYDLLDNRLFGLEWKRVDGIDLRLDVVHHSLEIGSMPDFYGDHRRVFGGRRADVVDAFDALNCFFHPDDHPLFHFFRRGAGVGHGNRDQVDRELGEDLLLDVAQGHQAADYDQHHQKIGGDAVSGEPTDRSVHDRSPSRLGSTTAESGL